MERKATEKKWNVWLYVVSVFFISFLADGVTMSFGVLLVEVLEEFKDKRATSIIVGSLVNGVMDLAGPLAGMLSDTLGGRATVVIGTLISFCGLLGATFAKSLLTLSIAYGFFGGMGFGLMYLPPLGFVTRNIEKQKALATGIAFCGSGAGTFVNNVLIRYLIDTFTWRGALLLTSAMVLNGIPCGLLLVPPTRRKKDSKTAGTADITKDGSENQFKRTLLNRMCNCRQILKANRRLLSNTRFSWFLVAQFMMALAFMVPITMLPDQAVETGMSKYQASWLASALGITNTVGRVVFGWLDDRKFVQRMVLYEAVLFLLAILTAVSPFLTSFEAKLSFSVVEGFLLGGFITLSVVVVTSLVSAEQIDSAYGIVMFDAGIAVFIALPISGLMFDITGSYTVTFVVAGGEFAVAGLILMCPILLQRSRQRKTFDITCVPEANAL